MPPESFPWERKDFLKERKHERSESFGSVARWRDSSHHARDFSRWGPGEFRRLPGHGRQRDWHMFSEEAGHGYAPSWTSGHKMLEDERGMPSSWRGDGKHGRNGRESRPFSQRDWRVHSWESSNGPRNSLGRSQYDVVNDHRSGNGIVTYPSHSQSDFVNTSNEIKPKDHPHDKIRNANGSSAGKKFDRENSLDISDWKPIKWTRSASLSSRGSGFSNSSSSKSLGVLDTNEAKSKSLLKNASFIESPPSDPVVCITSSPPCEDTNSRKKPRLGWGEGLAKYEKKKVDDPDVCISKDAVFSHSSVDIAHSLLPNPADKSPVAGFLDCASPTTPSSVACSSSPVVDVTSFVGKKSSADNDISTLCSSPSTGQGSQMHPDVFSCILDRINELDTSSFANLGSSLIQLLQSNDLNSDASGFVRSAAINKLLIFKSEISKELEVTESEIDSLENELKLMVRDSHPSIPLSPSPLPLEIKEEQYLKHQDGVSSLIVQSGPLEKISASAREIPVSNDGTVELPAEDNNCHDIATSKLVQPISQVREASFPNAVSSADLGAIQSPNVGGRMSPSCSISEKTDLALEVGGDLVEDEAGVLAFDDKHDCSVGEDTSWDSILASNHESAQEAFKVFDKLLTGCECKGTSNLSTLKNSKLVEVKMASRMQFLKFKERVVALKFEAFQRSWKEDMQLLSMRKSRTKSHKFSLRAMSNGHQKNRSSTCSRFSSPGNVSLGPSADIIDYAGKLLSESQGKVCRNTLKMPALILDKKEKMAAKFISNSGLVIDPCSVEKERSMINPWTLEEREIFMDKLALVGKDFSKIATFLDHKTTADCVEFYYKNHKSDHFQKAKKKLEYSENAKSVTNTYLVMLGKKWNREANAGGSLDMLGAASAMVAYESDKMRSRRKSSSLAVVGELKAICEDDRVSDQTRSFDFIENEKEAAAADVLAGICGSLSSEAMSSCITSSMDHTEGYPTWKYKNVNRHLSWGIISQDEDETCSDESCGELEPFDWTDEEKSIFVQALSSYGKDFVMISRCVRTRSSDQCKVFFSKARKCLGLDAIQTRGTPVSGDDGNEVGSDIEDACALEMDEGARPSVANVRDEDPSPPEASLTSPSRTENKRESSTINHQAARVLVFGVDQGKDKPLRIDGNRVGGGEASNVAKDCSQSLGDELGEDAKKINTSNSDQSDLPSPVNVSGGKATPPAIITSEDSFIISPPLGGFPERDDYGKVKSEHLSTKQVASSNIPCGNSLRIPVKRMDGNYYLKRCSSKPLCASNELSLYLEQQDKICRNGGNVKLFGKVLHHSSAQQASNVVQDEKEETMELCGKSVLIENNIKHMEHDKLHMSYETSPLTAGQEMQRRKRMEPISSLQVEAKAEGEALGDKSGEDR